MCELFGVTSVDPVDVDILLHRFYDHSHKHPNGWGLAIFRGSSVNIEKEPVAAYRSSYLRHRLFHKIKADHMIAHIRLATIGSEDYENCHPFVRQDRSGRTWTLAHNGTIFHCSSLDHYIHEQEGRTDSERVLCHIIAELDCEIQEQGHELTAEERFHVLDRVICQIAPQNKLNLLIYDGELMYVHTNYNGSLFVKQSAHSAIFSTTPLDFGPWQPLPLNRLCAYQNGRHRFTGTDHKGEYKDNRKDMEFLFLDYSGL